MPRASCRPPSGCSQAGEILARRPEAMQLRYLGTLLNIAGEKSSTIVFPLPMDLITSLGMGKRKDGA